MLDSGLRIVFDSIFVGNGRSTLKVVAIILAVTQGRVTGHIIGVTHAVILLAVVLLAITTLADSFIYDSFLLKPGFDSLFRLVILAADALTHSWLAWQALFATHTVELTALSTFAVAMRNHALRLTWGLRLQLTSVCVWRWGKGTFYLLCCLLLRCLCWCLRSSKGNSSEFYLLSGRRIRYRCYIDNHLLLLLRSLFLILFHHDQFDLLIDIIAGLLRRLLKLISSLKLYESWTLARRLIIYALIGDDSCRKAILIGKPLLLILKVTSLHTGWLLSLLAELLTIINGQIFLELL